MSTWDEVVKMKSKDTRHKGVANTLTDDELETILATIDFFGGSVQQAMFDLRVARYRVFDFLGMCVMGDRINSESAIKVLVYSFLKCEGDIDNWIQDLRITDYDVVNGWIDLELN